MILYISLSISLSLYIYTTCHTIVSYTLILCHVMLYYDTWSSSQTGLLFGASGARASSLRPRPPLSVLRVPTRAAPPRQGPASPPGLCSTLSARISYFVHILLLVNHPCFTHTLYCVHACIPTNTMDFRGFESSINLILRVGILMSIGDFPESLSQAILVGTMLVGGLGVPDRTRRPRPRMELVLHGMQEGAGEARRAAPQRAGSRSRGRFRAPSRTSKGIRRQGRRLFP